MKFGDALLEERLNALAEVLGLRRGLLELGLELELILQRRRVRMLEELLRHRDPSRRKRRVPRAELARPLLEVGRRRTSDTMPQLSASSAPSRRFETIHSNALAKPSSRWMNHVPPASGTSPIPMKPGTKLASVDAMRTSHAHARESPRRRQGPFTAAITGFSSARIARMFGW